VTSFLILLLVASCTSAPERPGSPAAAGSNVNLSGFPPEFRQGYADGCSSARGARVRDEARNKQDMQYAAGWRDGFDICRRK